MEAKVLSFLPPSLSHVLSAQWVSCITLTSKHRVDEAALRRGPSLMTEADSTVGSDAPSGIIITHRVEDPSLLTLQASFLVALPSSPPIVREFTDLSEPQSPGSSCLSDGSCCRSPGETELGQCSLSPQGCVPDIEVSS